MVLDAVDIAVRKNLKRPTSFSSPVLGCRAYNLSPEDAVSLQLDGRIRTSSTR